MIRGVTILWSLLALATGIGMYMLKHQVQTLEDDLASINRQVRLDREAIHVLEAEWTYLNDPSRLRELAEKHIALQPMAPAQVASLGALPPLRGPLSGKGVAPRSGEGTPGPLASVRQAAPAQGRVVASADSSRPRTSPVTTPTLTAELASVRQVR